MPRSSKTSLIETDSLGPVDGLERRFETYDLRFGSLDATLGDLQKNYSDMKLEMLSTVMQIKAPLEALLKAKQPSEAGTGKDQVEYWYSTYIKPLGKVFWNQFVRDLYARFSNVRRDSVIGEFNQLRQTAIVSDYYNHFEEQRAQVVEEFGALDEGYFIKSFIRGLKPEIRSRVEQFEVVILTKAIHIARKEEVAIANLFPHAKLHQTSSSTQPKPNTPLYSKAISQPIANLSIPLKPPIPNLSLSSNAKGVLPTPPSLPTKTSSTIKHLTHEEHQQKREQGLCYWCDGKFTSGHQKSFVKNPTSINAPKQAQKRPPGRIEAPCFSLTPSILDLTKSTDLDTPHTDTTIYTNLPKK
ncbi:hypothetical protein RJ640_010112 [Escallonia rubra]|uniref:Ty3 transposon capsid-like protein domain-containing protein n=1 Tax=Escallonia rubra TaxID=112253 RepID=A0AA88ULP1_9ASTE|nr:hypothetical protein RJ640_010112 [Escallonia rubra]